MMTLERFSRQMPGLFGRIFENDMFDGSNRNYSTTNTTLPAVNIKEDKDGFEVEMSAPGLKKADFRIELDQRLLTISSEKKIKNETKKGQRFTRREFSYQSFSRSFQLPETVEAEKIAARYENGILTLSIPKKEAAKPKPLKQIEIK